ncbi:Protein Rf1, mitochondrial [Zea mays]|uniref:Protein Rf1, mitochondrial n=1 Tax=Zea mays TaxID=4577 RepID=A0A3L6G6A2_MAIZE|nr:Protein Rf1, mitochondrial [Zea mays]
MEKASRAGRTVPAKVKFHEMTESGITMDKWTYNIGLSEHFKNRCSVEAILLFEELRAMNVKINIKTLNTMIAGMFQTRRVEEAKDLFASISRSGLVPSVVTYSIMMTNLIKGLVEEADDMFSSMENAGREPDSRLGLVNVRLQAAVGDPAAPLAQGAPDSDVFEGDASAVCPSGSCRVIQVLEFVDCLQPVINIIPLQVKFIIGNHIHLTSFQLFFPPYKIYDIFKFLPSKIQIPWLVHIESLENRQMDPLGHTAAASPTAREELLHHRLLLAAMQEVGNQPASFSLQGFHVTEQHSVTLLGYWARGGLVFLRASRLVAAPSLRPHVVVDAGEEVGVVPGEPQLGPSVGLRGDGGAELGRHEVAELLLGGAPTDVLLHRLQYTAAIDASVSFDVV